LEKLQKWTQKQEVESFTGQELRKTIRIAPSTLKRYLYTLRQYGLIEVLGGSQYRGYKYILTTTDNYEKMSEGIDKALDHALQSIKNK